MKPIIAMGSLSKCIWYKDKRLWAAGGHISSGSKLNLWIHVRFFYYSSSM